MDAKFSSESWESLCKMLGVKRRRSTAYHPQTDGQTERTNQVLEGYVQTFVNAYNNSATKAHKMTRFFANNGFHPQTEWMKETEARNPGATMYAH